MARKNRKPQAKHKSSTGSDTGPQLGGLVPQLTLRLILQISVIVFACLWIYGPALHGEWLWDDDVYVRQNPLLNDPDRLWKIWFSPGSLVEYYPLEQTVIWAQWQLWHGDPLGYHLTNLFLHIFNALLVWRLLGKLGLRLAWLRWIMSPQAGWPIITWEWSEMSRGALLKPSPISSSPSSSIPKSC